MEQPQQIGKYPISRRLGKGGMGQVWLGRNPDLDLPVAVKTLASHLADDDPLYVDRFIKEARTAARLSHENIVRIFDAGSDDGVNFLVMEYVQGGSVRDLLSQADGPLPTARALWIAGKVARGLEAAGKLEIIHRDIKPDNILLDADGTPKLADLGLAKQLGGSDGHSLTTTGISVGTPGYISPEQAQDSKNVDARADIYSLGATLYHMLTGVPPFTGSSAFAVMMKHVTEPLPDPRERNPLLGDGACELLAKLMAKDPADRPQTASEAAALLEALALELDPELETVVATVAAPSVPTLEAAPTVAESAPGVDEITQGETLMAGHGTTTLFAPAGGAVNASFAQRAQALAIDLLIVGIVNGLLGGTWPGFLLILVIYNAGMLPRDGQTVGKSAIGLRVVDKDGHYPSTNVALLRGVGYIFSSFFFGLGFALALITQDKRTLHDMIASTRVVALAEEL